MALLFLYKDLFVSFNIFWLEVSFFCYKYGYPCFLGFSFAWKLFF